MPVTFLKHCKRMWAPDDLRYSKSNGRDNKYAAHNASDEEGTCVCEFYCTIPGIVVLVLPGVRVILKVIIPANVAVASIAFAVFL